MIKISSKGNFRNTEKFLNQSVRNNYMAILEKYGREGVSVLSAATPVESGLTSRSWSYNITHTRRGFEINWSNSNVVNGVNIAIILQYGHGTRNGGFVQGRDYINPAIQQVFAKMADDVWREVTKL